MSAKPSIRTSMTRCGFLAALPVVPLAVPVANRRFAGNVAYDFRPIRSMIAEAAAAGNAIGLSVAAVHRGRIVWEDGFGWADPEAKWRATAHRPFTLASLSKPLTTTVMATYC